ncbi:GNAT family N-acetyltransferase [Glutamicibacter ardleyensis]|uniref:GNAT family N-acetyltransferase n=1 Tax=Glutamicibacter ardleyensis TaxID=225894 RepID=UPI003FD65160
MSLFNIFRRKKTPLPEDQNRRFYRSDSERPEAYFKVIGDDRTALIGEYQAIDQFFSEHIADTTRNKLTNAYNHKQADDLVIVAYQAQELVGAIWAGAPHNEADGAIAMGKMQGKQKEMERLAQDMRQHSWMLHDMAVHPKYRRRGIGFELLNRVIEEASSKEIDLLWGVASPESVAFYKRSPVMVMPPEGALTISNSPRAKYGLPITGESRWIHCRLRQTGALDVGYVPQNRL